MRSSGWSSHASVSIDAPPSCVWKAIVDIEASKAIIPSIQSLECSADDSTMQMGARWKEVRNYKGRDIVLIKTVTSMNENDPYYDVQINVDFPSHPHVTNTSTLSIQPDGKDKSRSILVGTMAVQAAGLFQRLSFMCLACFVQRETSRDFQHEMECYETAASYMEYLRRLEGGCLQPPVWLS